MIEPMPVIHMTEAEAVRDSEGLLKRVRAGEEVVIGSGASVPVLVRAAAPLLGTPLSELIECAAARERERGYAIRMDPDFAIDPEEIVHTRKPRDLSAWE